MTRVLLAAVCLAAGAVAVLIGVGVGAELADRALIGGDR